MTISITLIILVVTSLISILCFNNRELFDQLKHNPYIENKNKEYYRLISSGFVHGSWWHLGINMFVLYEFGKVVEAIFVNYHGTIAGRLFFAIAYILMVVTGDLPTFKKHANNPYYSSIGASGAVSGVLFMYIIYYPFQLLYLYFAIPIPAIILGFLYLFYSSWASKNQKDLVDHQAHFYGAIAGVILIIGFIPSSISRFANIVLEKLSFLL